MKLPVFFELNGKFAAMLPTPDGGVSVSMTPGSPSIADFMQDGMIVDESEVPAEFLKFAKKHI